MLSSSTAQNQHSETQTPDDYGPRTSRRDAVRLAGSGALLAALAAAHLTAGAAAQGATPAAGATPVAGATRVGLYVVVRSRTVKAGMSIDALNTATQQGLVPLIRALPGFVEYDVIQNSETRDRIAVSIFTTKAGADASTQTAADFLTSHGLTGYYESVQPDVKEGTIVTSATA